MKKFIIVLMVVAVSSFLFVGCLPGTTTPVTPVEPVEPVEPVVVATVAPIITSITDNAAVPAVVISLTATTVYMNKAEVALGIIVNGTAPTYSEVKVYIDDICAGTADVGTSGTFSVVIAKADLGADGEKTLYATAKEAAIAVSAKSVEYTFTLDTDLPGIDSVAATAIGVGATVGNATATAVGTHATDGTSPLTATTTPANVVSGTWLITIIAPTGINNVAVTHLGVTDLYTMVAGQVIPEDLIIPGVGFTMMAGPLATGNSTSILCAANVTAIAGRATLKYDEDVSYTAATAATCVYGGNLTTPAFAAYKESNDTYYFTMAGPAAYFTAAITVYGVADLAGNVGGTAASPLSATCTVGVASATALLP